MKPEEMKSMRRNKVIADNKPQKVAADAATDSLEALNNISSKLDDVQAASELTSQSVEDKGNGIIESIGDLKNSTDNTAEGTELIAEVIEKQTEVTKSINEVSSAISSKLDRLATLLEQKLQTSTAIQNTGGTSLEAIENAIPVKVVDNETSDELFKALPTPEKIDNKPDEDFFPAPVQESANSTSDSKGGISFKLSDKIAMLTKTVQTGFNKSISISDRIAGMLFKYTITAAIEAAKMAALILGIVIGIDLLIVHFKYWTDKFTSAWDLFDENFTKFSDEAKEWGKFLSDIFTSIDSIKQLWEAGDWGGLTVAIVKGVGTALMNLGELIQLGMAKLSASILRAIGFGDTADEIEGRALEGFQETTGNKLKKEDQEKVAKYQMKRDDGELGTVSKGLDMLQRGKTFVTNWVRGNDNKEEFSTSDERAAESAKLKELPEEERKEAYIKANETRAALVRFEDYIDKIDMTNPENAKNVEKSYADLSKLIKDPELNKTPVIKKELDARFEKLNNKMAEAKKAQATVKPESSSKSPEAKQVQSIEKGRASESKQQQPVAAISNTNNVVKKNTVVQNMTPVTSTTAPGIFHATGVN